MVQAIAKAAYSAADRANRFDVIYIYEDRRIFRALMPAEAAAAALPDSCRWAPDYFKLRSMGAMVGGAIPALWTLMFIIIAIKASFLVGLLGGILTAMMVPFGAIMGWVYAPTFPWHDYRPIRVVRREEDEEGNPTIKPYGHSFLFLPSLHESEEGNEEKTPHVATAASLYQDMAMRDEKDFHRSPMDKWHKIEIGALVTLVGAMLIALFFLIAVKQ